MTDNIFRLNHKVMNDINKYGEIIDNNYEIKIENEEIAHTLLKNLVNKNIEIDKFELKKPTLNDIFIEKVGE